MINNLDTIASLEKNNLILKEWAKQYPEEFKDSIDELILQTVLFETFYMKNRTVIDLIVKDLNIDNDYYLISEGMGMDILADIAIGVGSAIPGIGSAVAVGGMIYYIVRGINAWNKGEKLASVFEAFSAIGASAAFVPGVGPVINTLMQTIGKWAKKIFTFFTPGAKLTGSIMKLIKFSKGGAKAAADPKVIKAEGELIKSTLEGFGGKAAVGGIKKIGSMLETVLKFVKGSKFGDAVIAKFPTAAGVPVELMETAVKSLKSIGKLADDVMKAEADDILEVLARNSDEVADVANAAGADELAKKIATLEAKQAKAAGHVTKKSDDVMKGASKVDDLAKGSKKASEKLADDIADSLGKSLELPTVRSSGLNKLAVSASDDIVENMSKQLPDMFGKMDKGYFKEFLKRSGNIKDMQEAAIKSLTNKNPKLANHLKGLKSDDFASYFADQFLKNPGKIKLKKIVPSKNVVKKAAGKHREVVKMGDIGFEIMGSNGAKLVLKPNNLATLYGPREAGQILARTYGAAGKEVLETAYKETLEKLIKDKAALDGMKKVIQKRGLKINNLKAQLQALRSAGGEVAEEVAEEIVESAAKNSKFATGMLKMGVKGWAEMATGKILTTILGRILGEGFSQSDFEELESGDQDYLRTDSERNNQSSDDVIIRQGQGLTENYMLEDIIMYSKINSSRIRSQKLISLIN